MRDDGSVLFSCLAGAGIPAAVGAGQKSFSAGWRSRRMKECSKSVPPEAKTCGRNFGCG